MNINVDILYMSIPYSLELDKKSIKGSMNCRAF